MRRIAMHLNRLDTSPDFEAEYTLIQSMVNGTTVGNPDLELYSYLAQVIDSACTKSGVKVPDEASDLLSELFLIDQNATAPGFNATAAEERALVLSLDATTSIIKSALSGTLWLYPAAVSNLPARPG